VCVACLGDDKVIVVVRGSKLRRASGYSGLLRWDSRTVTMEIAFTWPSHMGPRRRQKCDGWVLASMICLDNNMCLSYVPRSVTSARAPACYMLYYYCYICMCV
jgi:hypothetical protein